MCCFAADCLLLLFTVLHSGSKRKYLKCKHKLRQQTDKCSTKSFLWYEQELHPRYDMRDDPTTTPSHFFCTELKAVRKSRFCGGSNTRNTLGGVVACMGRRVGKQGGKPHRGGESKSATGRGKRKERKGETRTGRGKEERGKEAHTLQESCIEPPGWTRAEKKVKKRKKTDVLGAMTFSEGNVENTVKVVIPLLFSAVIKVQLCLPRRTLAFSQTICECRQMHSTTTVHRESSFRRWRRQGTLRLISAVYRLIASRWIRKTLAGMASLLSLWRFQSSKNSASLCKAT